MKNFFKKFNWKTRFRNKTFVITFATAVVAFVYQILGLFGVVPQISQSDVTSYISTIANFLFMLGILVDPTTSGVGDSELALQYGKYEDDAKEASPIEPTANQLEEVKAMIAEMEKKQEGEK